MPRPPRFARLRTAALLVLLGGAAAACGGDDNGRDGAADPLMTAADSALERDLALAASTSSLPETFGDTALGSSGQARPTPRATPAPREVPRGTVGAPQRTPRPVTPRPAPAAQPRPDPVPSPAAPAPSPAPAPAPVPAGSRGPRLAVGTGIAVATNQRVCTTGNLPGDKITATVARDVIGEDGARIPAGSKVVLEVASVTRGARPEDATIVFRIRTLDDGVRSYPASGRGSGDESLERVRTTSRTTDAKKVAAGAAIGAILGQVLGKDTKGTVIGAAAGAAAGAGAASATAQYDACLPSGSAVTLTLDSPVIMS